MFPLLPNHNDIMSNEIIEPRSLAMPETAFVPCEIVVQIGAASCKHVLRPLRKALSCRRRSRAGLCKPIRQQAVPSAGCRLKSNVQRASARQSSDVSAQLFCAAIDAHRHGRRLTFIISIFMCAAGWFIHG